MSVRLTDPWDGAVYELEDMNAYHASPWWCLAKVAWQRSDRPKRCFICGRLDIELHHTRYDRLGFEIDDLVPLCEDHHYEVEKFLKSEHPGVTRQNAHVLYHDSLAQRRYRFELKPF